MSIVTSVLSQGSPTSEPSYLSLLKARTLAFATDQTSIFPCTSPQSGNASPSFDAKGQTAPLPTDSLSHLEDLEQQQRHHLQQFYYFQQLAIERYTKAQEQGLREQKEIEEIFRQYSFGGADQANLATSSHNEAEEAFDPASFLKFDTLSAPSHTATSLGFPRQSSASFTSLTRVPSLIASSPSSASDGNQSTDDLIMQSVQTQLQQHNQYQQQEQQQQYSYGPSSGPGAREMQHRPLPYAVGNGNGNQAQGYGMGAQFEYAPKGFGYQAGTNGAGHQNGYSGSGDYQVNQVGTMGPLSAQQMVNIQAGQAQFARHPGYNYASLGQFSTARTSLDGLAGQMGSGLHGGQASAPVLGPFINNTSNGQIYQGGNGMNGVPMSAIGGGDRQSAYSMGPAPDCSSVRVKEEVHSPGHAASHPIQPAPQNGFPIAHLPKLSGKATKVKKSSPTSQIQTPYDRRLSNMSQANCVEHNGPSSASIVTLVAMNGPRAVEPDELPENVRNPLGGGRGYMPGETPDDPTKRHHCGICGRGFARLYNLKSHAQTHDPERPKPHDCPHQTCKKSFSRLHDLERHRQGIHNDGPLVDAKRQDVTPALARAQNRIVARAERGELV